MAFKKSDFVDIIDEDIWWRGQVLEVNDEIFHITFDGYGPRWNAWKSASEIRECVVSKIRFFFIYIVFDYCLLESGIQPRSEA